MAHKNEHAPTATQAQNTQAGPDTANASQENEPKEDERRRYHRKSVQLAARYLGPDGEEADCQVINISAAGALLSANNPPPKDSDVILYIEEVGRFPATVVRASERSFAVKYKSSRAKTSRAADAIMQAIHFVGRPFDRRKALRIKTSDAATAIFEDGTEVDCSILDMSLTGASLEIKKRPPIGSIISLGKMSAKVLRHHAKGVVVTFEKADERLEEVYTHTRNPKI